MYNVKGVAGYSSYVRGVVGEDSLANFSILN